MTTTNRMFPGMGCASVEFFLEIKETPELKVIQNSKVIPFSEIPFSIIRILEEAIHLDKEANLELHDMHPTSKMKRTEQFAICRFGGLDFQGDIKDGELQEGEYWSCPSHGNCKSEGILCKLPKINGEHLTKQEVQLMQYTSSDMTNEVIASELNLPFGSFHKAKKFLYEKLGVQTKQEVVRIAVFLNLIQL